MACLNLCCWIQQHGVDPYMGIISQQGHVNTNKSEKNLNWCISKLYINIQQLYNIHLVKNNYDVLRYKKVEQDHEVKEEHVAKGWDKVKLSLQNAAKE